MRRAVVLLATTVLTLLVASAVALAVTRIGTDGPDTLMGTKGSDELLGRGGTDWIDGRAGKDVISGGPGDDNPLSSRAIGQLDGGRGADVISGGPGQDDLWDGPWPGDSAVDTLEGGDGNDFLGAANRPAARDIVSCGAGRDFAYVDRKDIVSDCERIFR
jgi:Ca2+-binding RTX toxin-like protein